MRRVVAVSISMLLLGAPAYAGPVGAAAGGTRDAAVYAAKSTKKAAKVAAKFVVKLAKKAY